MGGEGHKEDMWQREGEKKLLEWALLGAAWQRPLKRVAIVQRRVPITWDTSQFTPRKVCVCVSDGKLSPRGTQVGVVQVELGNWTNDSKTVGNFITACLLSRTLRCYGNGWIDLRNLPSFVVCGWNRTSKGRTTQTDLDNQTHDICKIFQRNTIGSWCGNSWHGDTPT